MKKIRFKDIFPEAIGIELALEILKENGAIEVQKIEGEEGFVILDEEGQPISEKELDEISEAIRRQFMAKMLAEYFQEHASKGDMAEVDLENQQLIIYEHDKDKEMIDKMRPILKTSKEVSPVYIS